MIFRRENKSLFETKIYKYRKILLFSINIIEKQTNKQHNQTNKKHILDIHFATDCKAARTQTHPRSLLETLEHSMSKNHRKILRCVRKISISEKELGCLIAINYYILNKRGVLLTDQLFLLFRESIKHFLWLQQHDIYCHPRAMKGKSCVQTAGLNAQLRSHGGDVLPQRQRIEFFGH